jgi:hypothetical protein
MLMSESTTGGELEAERIILGFLEYVGTNLLYVILKNLFNLFILRISDDIALFRRMLCFTVT